MWNLEEIERYRMQCLLFSYRCRKETKLPDYSSMSRRAETILLRYCQQSAFQDEMKRLENDKEVLQDSKLFALYPFLDRNDDLIHVRGRIDNADVPKEMKEPIILPANNRITQLLIEDIHYNTGHVEVKHMVSKLRENYWVLRCVSEVKKVIGRCIFCRRQNRPLQSQLMAQLPEERLVADRPPFDSTGIDYFGPLMVRVGRSSVKRWAVILHMYELPAQCILKSLTRWTLTVSLLHSRDSRLGEVRPQQYSLIMERI